MELVHKDDVLKMCKKLALEEAMKVCSKYAGRDEQGNERKNPWNRALDKTMFWM
jgi:hypothetical protein